MMNAAIVIALLTSCGLAVACVIVMARAFRRTQDQLLALAASPDRAALALAQPAAPRAAAHNGLDVQDLDVDPRAVNPEAELERLIAQRPEVRG